MEPNELCLDWLRRIQKAQLGHIKSAIYFDRLNLWLGIPVVVLTTLVGTSIFATIRNEASTSVKIAAGVASVLAAILAGIQTFLRYSERAEKHRAVGGKYGILRRELEQKLAFTPPDSEEMQQYIDSLRLRWDKLSEECPTAPQRVWDGLDAAMKASQKELTKGDTHTKTAV